MNAPEKPSQFKVVGTRPVRPDGIDKVTGKAIYSPDFVAPGMIHGAILRSPHAHARIRSINTRKAEALPGVKAVVTGHDFPAVESLDVELGEGSGNILYTSRNCMALEKALYHGHAVAAVAATSELIAQAALALIEVDYEVLPHVITVAEAQAPGAPVLHDNIFTKGLDETPTAPSNTAERFVIASGDPEAALTGSAVVVEASFSTQPVHQGYIEPHGCVASWNSDGQAQIWASSQGAFMIRQLTAEILGLKQADIRVTPLEIGGGFGGKTTIYLEPVAMLLSRKSGRPVRIVMSRDEVFRASGPAPGTEATVRIGAAADGTLTGAIVEFTNRSGAFPGGDVHPSAMHALAHYRIPAKRITGWEVLCNMPSIAAYRAPGAPQTVFPVECCIDELAVKLGIDPIELRLKNAVRPGDIGVNRLPIGAIGYVECLEAAKAHPHYSAPLGPNQGRGIAGGSWSNYGGPSTAQVSVAEDGSVLVVTGSPDIGGSRASMAMMAAETFGLPYESVRVTIADTASIGVSMLTGGSRTTFATGRAVVDAAKAVIATLSERAAKIWGAAASDVEWRGGAAHCLTGENKGQSLSIGQISAKAGQFSGQVSAEVSVTSPDYLPGFAVHICDTELDPETGHLRIVRYTAVQDVGRAIHPDYVEGQMQGGAAQGIGWALSEAYSFNSAGVVENAGFLDYRMPVCSDLPMIDTVMIEVPNPGHPYGVKGVGEVPIVPPLAAVAIAASHAAGVPLRHLPLSPDTVYAALQAKA
ncbi:MAG: xanthine dehydrogenase family protein molybdopterin-binding subunit [Novosphingobium sp.]